MNAMVSVIIPTRNRGPFLRKAVESVRAQSRGGVELIIVDSDSTDDTPSILGAFGDWPTVLRIDAGNPGAARNLGIRAARSPFIAFLDSDDWWHPDKLAIQIKAMEENPSYLISHTQEIWYSGGRRLRQRGKHRKYHGCIFDRCLQRCAVSPSTVVARRAFFDTVGMFDESFVCCEDYELWLRASVSQQFLLIDRPLTFKDGGRADQMSRIHRVGMDRLRIRALMKLLCGGSFLTDAQRALALGELARKCRIYGEGCLKHGKKQEGEYYLELAEKGVRTPKPGRIIA